MNKIRVIVVLTVVASLAFLIPAGTEALAAYRSETVPAGIVEPGTPTLTVHVDPVTAIGSQDAVDTGQLVTWTTDPVCVLAGHNTMGWAWMDDLERGSVVKVGAGPCQGVYQVIGHRRQDVKGGPIPDWMADPAIDLVLQTCQIRGMGFSLLQRV